MNNLIIHLETTLLQPEVRSSKEKLDALLADDFFECGESGNTYSKKDILNDLSNEPAMHFVPSDFTVTELSPNTILVTYFLERVMDATSKKSYSRRCSLWKMNGGNWQMIFHQGTPCKA